MLRRGKPLIGECITVYLVIGYRSVSFIFFSHHPDLNSCLLWMMVGEGGLPIFDRSSHFISILNDGLRRRIDHFLTKSYHVILIILYLIHFCCEWWSKRADCRYLTIVSFHIHFKWRSEKADWPLFDKVISFHPHYPLLDTNSLSIVWKKKTIAHHVCLFSGYRIELSFFFSSLYIISV